MFSIEDVLRIAGHCQTEPICSSFGSKPAFAALIAVYNASGELEASWISEPMFESPEAAVEHAKDLCGPELWAIISCGW